MLHSSLLGKNSEYYQPVKIIYKIHVVNLKNITFFDRGRGVKNTTVYLICLNKYFDANIIIISFKYI